MRCLNLSTLIAYSVHERIKFPSPLGDEVLKPMIKIIVTEYKATFPSPLGDEVLKPHTLRYLSNGYQKCFRPLSGMRCLNQSAQNLVALVYGKFPSPLGDEVLKPSAEVVYRYLSGETVFVPSRG